jgi:hypothetical protein
MDSSQSSNEARSRSRGKARARQDRVRSRRPPNHPRLFPPVPSALQAEREEQVVRQLILELPDGTEKQTAWLFVVDGVHSAREIEEQLGVGKRAVTMRPERFRAARVNRGLLRRMLAVRGE